MNDSSAMLPLGKLAPDFLSRLIEKYTTGDESIVVGPQIGGDATVIDQGDHYLIAKTDPITFVTDEIGYYVININTNDIACTGGIPRWFLCTLLLPEKITTAEMVENIFSQLNSACRQLNISFCGGHTEVTYGIDRPIVIGQMLGIVDKNMLINNKNAQPGDDILLTKGIAVEATSIIARVKGERIADIYSKELVEKCKNFLYDPGISVLKDAQLAVRAGGVHALHDPTEGGLAMGLHELAIAANAGIKVFDHEIPVLPESKLLCDQYDIDLLGVIASGALLIVADRKKSAAIMDSLRRNNIEVKNIGKIMPPEEGVKIVVDGEEIDLPEFPQDEITKLFS